MEEGLLTEGKLAKHIEKVLKTMVVGKGYGDIRANHEDYPIPAKLKSASLDGDFIPDITARIRDTKSYFEIAVKSKDVDKVVTKWKLLSKLASMKGGKFFLLAPYGNFSFASRLCEDHDIPARLIKLT